MTVAELLKLIPEKTNPFRAAIPKKVIENFKEAIKGYGDNQILMETCGDIEEFAACFKQHRPENVSLAENNNVVYESEYEMVVGIFSILNQMWGYGLISAYEATQLEGNFRVIRDKYPALYRTMLIWAWG